jgi:hypothetical protein
MSHCELNLQLLHSALLSLGMLFPLGMFVSVVIIAGFSSLPFYAIVFPILYFVLFLSYD